MGYSLYKTTPEKPIIQCYKCQKLDHSAFLCFNSVVCLKCGGSHNQNECTAEQLYCSNCGGNHAACSRKCPYLINSLELKKIKFIPATTESFQSKPFLIRSQLWLLFRLFPQLFFLGTRNRNFILFSSILIHFKLLCSFTKAERVNLIWQHLNHS